MEEEKEDSCLQHPTLSISKISDLDFFFCRLNFHTAGFEVASS